MRGDVWFGAIFWIGIIGWWFFYYKEPGGERGGVWKRLFRTILLSLGLTVFLAILSPFDLAIAGPMWRVVTVLARFVYGLF